MKRSLWLILTLLAFLLSPVSRAEDYQGRIFYFLNNEYFPQPLPRQYGYSELYEYLLKLNSTNGEFDSYKKQRNWRLTLSEEKETRRITINHVDFEIQPLPLYPALENNLAVIASYQDSNSEGYLRLPEELQRFCNKHRTDAWPDPARQHPPVTVENLRGAFPEFSAEPFWLVGEKETGPAELVSLTLSQNNSGSYRLELKFQEGMPNPVFIFRAKNGQQLPQISRSNVSISKLPSGLDRKKVFIAPVNETKDLLYIGSLDFTNSGFDLLWDTNTRSIVYLSVVCGYCRGNETRYLNRNYPIHFNEDYYVLRVAEKRNYAELIYFEGSSLKQTVLFD